MKDQGPNLRDIKRKAREKQSYDWKGTFIRAIVAAVITPFKYLGGILALVMGTVKIVLTLVGLITTVLIIAGTIIFKSVWKDSFQKPFEAVQEHSALVINLDSKLLEKASVDFVEKAYTKAMQTHNAETQKKGLIFFLMISMV